MNSPTTSQKKRPTRVPKGLVVTDDTSQWSATWRWVDWSRLGIAAIFIVPWDAFVVFWYYQVITKGTSWLTFLFPLIHTSLGLWMTYWFIAQVANRTRITVAAGRVIVRHWPLPWPGNRTYSAADMEQVFIAHQEVEERVLGRTRMRHWYRLTADMNPMHGKSKEVRLATLTNAGCAAYMRRELKRRISENVT